MAAKDGLAGADGAGHPTAGGAMLTASADADAGLVLVTGRGFWDDAVVAAHFRELKALADRVRATHASVRVLVDLREADVQAPAIVARIKHETRLVWTERDRIAVVLQSALAKMQIDRVVDSGNHATFKCLEDATDWLGLAGAAPSPPHPARTVAA